jgi:DHA1 family multidrug resistance protein-like MFS transporter
MTQKQSLGILFFNMTVVMLSFGIIIPLLPFMIEDMGGAGLAMGSLMSIFSITQFIFSPIWGGLSDKIGRKKVLMIGAAGNAIGLIVMGLAPDLITLYIGRALGGMLSSALQSAAMAYISDSTDDKSRGGGMGIIGAAFGLGMVIGPGIGGLFGTLSHEAAFYFGAFLSVAGAVLIQFFLPESLPEEKRHHDAKIKSVQFNLMFAALATPIGFLLIQAFLNNFALTNFEGMFGMYAERRFDYDEVAIGSIMMVVGTVATIAQGLLTGPATQRFGDAAVIKASLIGSAIGFVLMIYAFDFTTVLLTTSFFIFSNSMLRPGISSLISKRTTYNQGIAMGLNNSFMSLGRIVGPIWAGIVLDWDLSYPFITGAVVMAFAYIASLAYLKD